MTAAQPVGVIFAGAAIALAVATAVARILALRAFSNRARPAIENLNARIDAWWVMVGVLAFAFAFGSLGVTFLFAVLSFCALREFVTRSRAHPGDHWPLTIAFYVVLPLQYLFIASGEYELFATLIPVYAFLFVPIVLVVRGDTENFLERVAEMQWGVMLCVFCLSHIPALSMLEIPQSAGERMVSMAFILLIAQVSDVMQYVFGKLLGRRRIAPRVSPAKTVAGAVGGVGSATLLGMGVSALTPFEPRQAGLLALVVALVGLCGGLVLSAVKRSRDAKHWGWVIRGHGGVLDRVDSVAFAAPVYFHLLKLHWVT